MTSGLGEFGRIARYFAPLAGPGGLGLTDDAALVECAHGHRLVMTVDAMVEGVHYLPDDPPDLVARKLLRVNLSDIAAMGARPLHYLITTALPARFGDDWVERFAAGLAEDQRLFGVDLLGGDSVSTPGPAMLSLTAIGEVATGAELRRSGAQPGDDVWVSGTIGDAYLGLLVLRGGLPELPADARTALARCYQLPEPRTTLGPRLAGIAHAMQDVSDGLLADLGHICEASGVSGSVELPALPLSLAARQAVTADPSLAVQLATGGDDYELLFTAPATAAPALSQLAAAVNIPITRVGTIEPGRGLRLLDAGGHEVPVGEHGYRHF
jgi:thiamine-monophosphate kinase